MTQYAQESALNAAGRFGRFSYLAWNCLLAIVASIILGIFIAIRTYALLFIDSLW